MSVPICLSKDPTLPSRAIVYRKKVEELVGKASDDFITLQARVNKAVRIGTRAERLSYIRVAGMTDFSRSANADDLAVEYKNLGFNTIVINDILLVKTITHDRIYLSDTQILNAITFARKHNFNIILSFGANHFGLTPAMSADLVKFRFARWMLQDQGDIVGIYLTTDDFYLVQEPVATQIAWRDAIREVATDVPVLFTLGDLSILADTATIGNYYSRRAFDHVLMLSYPYNLSNHPTYGAPLLAKLQQADPTVVALNNVTSTAPQDDLRRYLRALYVVARGMYFDGLLPGQRIIPVAEAFVYTGTVAGKYVNVEDIASEVTELNAIVKGIVVSSPDWNPMAFFYWGPGTFPEGIYNHPEWWDSLRVSNNYLQDQACIATEGGVLARYVLGIK